MKKTEIYKKGINDASDVYREKFGILRENISEIQKDKIILIQEIIWYRVS